MNEVLHETPLIGWGEIMGPGPQQDWAIGTMLVIAANVREIDMLAGNTKGQVSIDYWVQQADCTDAFVLVADEGILFEIRAVLDLSN